MADHKTNEQGALHHGGPSVASQPKGTGEDNSPERTEQEEKRLQEDAQEAPMTHPNRHGGKSDAGKGSYN